MADLKLAIELLKCTDASQNYASSPMLWFNLLCVLREGCTPGSELHAKLTELVGDGSVRKDDAVKQASFLFAKGTVTDFFQQTCEKAGVAVSSHERILPEAVNACVKDATDGMIEKAFDNISEDTRAVLMCCIVMDKAWKNKWDKSLTRDIKNGFTGFDGKTKHDVRMMKRTGPALYAVGDYTGVCLPYDHCDQDRVMDAVLFMPRESGKEAMDKMLASFAKDGVPFEFCMRDVELHVPTLDIESDVDMKQALRGVAPELFEGAALDKILEGEGLQIDEALSKTRIKVDEAGTKAASMGTVTTARGLEPAEPPKPIPLFFNRPFVFMVVHGANTLFFCVVDSVQRSA